MVTRIPDRYRSLAQHPTGRRRRRGNLVQSDPNAEGKTFELKPAKSDFAPHVSPLVYILILRLIRGGIGAFPIAGPPLVELTFGIKDEFDRKKLERLIAELHVEIQNLRSSVPVSEITSAAKDQSALESSSRTELEGSVEDIVARLKDSSIEECARLQPVSRGRLVRKRKISRGNGISIGIDDLAVGELFFPLNFLRDNLTNRAGRLIIPQPFDALFEPEVCNGVPKWICVEFANDQFVLRAYPKPIKLDSAGQVRQVDEVVVDSSNPSNNFEYWPNGWGSDNVDKVELLVDIKFGKTFQLRFQEKHKISSAVLILNLSYKQ